MMGTEEAPVSEVYKLPLLVSSGGFRVPSTEDSSRDFIMDSCFKSEVMLEKQLRQKLFLLENGVARIAHTRNQLKDNADLVKREIRACFGHQLCCLRSREQQLLSTLDTVLTVKDELLSEQQDQLHQAFGACRQGLECMAVAKEDMKKKNNQASLEAVEQNVQDILNKLSSVEIEPREASQISFEADTMSLRRTLHSFGRISTCKKIKACESLPGDLEDYDEEPTLLHKPVQKEFSFGIMRQAGLSSDGQSWLMKEALSGPTSTEMDASGLMRRSGRQKEQVTHWLHQIKTQVEAEPAVFEDFQIDRRRYGSDYSESFVNGAERKDVDQENLFAPYFTKVWYSPVESWILRSDNEPPCPPCPRETVEMETDIHRSVHSYDLPANQQSPLLTFESRVTPAWLRIFADVQGSDKGLWLSSSGCPLNSDSEQGDIERVSNFNASTLESGSVAANFRGMEVGEEAECCSPDPFFTTIQWLDKERWLLRHEEIDSQEADSASLVANLHNLEVGEEEEPCSWTDPPFATVNWLDKERWLLRNGKSPSAPETEFRNRPINLCPSSLEVWDSILGWQSVLERVHASREDNWLLDS